MMVPEAVLPSPLIHQKSETVTRDRLAVSVRNAGAGGAHLLNTPLAATETWAAAVALTAIIALRIVYAFVYHVDSDEPQHLHVVWGWAHGLLPYRDLFDNHSPLFQMLCAPLFWALGEHAWIVVPMRLAMLPLFLADLYLVYLIGRTLYGQRWGVWMAIVAGCMPAFFLVTTEFRTDDLWTTLWLAAVYLAVCGPLAGRRAFLFGLTMGACFSVSMKSSLLLISLCVAGLGLLALHALSRRQRDPGTAIRSALLILAGLIIVPGLLVSFFALKGALPQMYYCVIVHNSVPGLGKWAKSGFHEWLFPLSLPVLLGLGWLCMHSSANERIGAGRALILMSCGVYYFLLRSYWPLVTAQDFIPILPLVAVCVLAFVFHLLSLTGFPARIVVPVTGLVLLAGGLAWAWRLQSPLNNEMLGFEQNLAVVLHLTNPDDLVMDGKGETIFRNRPIYWVLEGITIKRIALGLIPNDVQARIIQTGTCVAVNHRLRPEDQGWLRTNFIEGDGKVWVAGKKLGPAHPTISFHTAIKGQYSFVTDHGKVSGTLDGAPLRDSQQIPAGDHQLKIDSGSGDVAVVWSQALQRGFDPFSKKITSFTAE
jgi:hypothetical protein